MSRRKKDPKVQLLEDQFAKQLDRFEKAEAKLRRAAKAWDREGRKMKRLLKRLCDAEGGAEERFLQLGTRRQVPTPPPANGGAT